MSGSIKWFEYQTDSGAVFAISMDESNGEAVGNLDYTNSSTVTFKLPSNVKKRFARYVSNDGVYTRTIPVGRSGISANDLPQTITAQVAGSGTGVVLSLSQYVGEQLSMIPKAFDTGLNDGDET